MPDTEPRAFRSCPQCYGGGKVELACGRCSGKGSVDLPLSPWPVTWPEDGPATERGPAGLVIYRKPTIYNLVTPGMTSARSDVQIGFAFTEEDGTQASYKDTVTQDALFRLLLAGGFIKREGAGRVIHWEIADREGS